MSEEGRCLSASEGERKRTETNVSEERQLNVDEAQAQTPRKKGGWITFPFITVSAFAVSLAVSGQLSNIIVYLIKEYNVKSIDSNQIYNIVSGCTSLTPVAGAIISDAYFGSFPVVAFATVTILLSSILLTLTAALQTLRPSPCPVGSSICETASAGQLAVLYISLGLLAVGTGGTRYNTMTMGADQFDRRRDQDIFFNWYFIGLYAGAVLGGTAIIYVEDSVSWALGFGLCAATSAISVIVLLLGVGLYHKPSAKGSPFTDLARVVVATIRKRRIAVPPNNLGYCYGPDEAGKPSSSSNLPSQIFSFLNRAALISQGDANPDGTIAKPWRLCTIQQVEDLKVLIRMFPLWTSCIFVSVLLATQNSLTILQALTMDRSLGHHLTIPAGSMQVVTLTATAIFISIFDRLLLPLWHYLTKHIPTPLQRIGLGHVLNAAAMAASALVERRRAAIVHAHHAEGQAAWIVPMSALWLALPLVITGAGEALHFPGQVALYYQEFPQSLRSMATAMVGLIIAIAYYLSTAVVGLIRRATNWLPDNLNTSRLDFVYWLIAVLGMINFGYYLLCAKLYKYRRVTDMVEPDPR